MIKWVAFVVWLAAVVLITIWMWHATEPPKGFVASHALEANHRIIRADLEPYPTGANPLEGKYVHEPIPAGKEIRPDKLRDAPAIVPAKGNVPYFLTLKPEWNLQGAINTGSKVDIWNGTKAVGQSVNVLAVLAEPMNGVTRYIAVLEVDGATAAKLDKTGASSRVLVSQFESGGH